MSPTEMIALGSVAVAFVSVVVSPWVALRIAERQIRAQVLASNRQAWIDSLRDDLSALLACVHTVGLERVRGEGATVRYLEAVRESEMLLNRVELRLNFEEDAHRRLAEQLGAALRYVSKAGHEPGLLAGMTAGVRQTAQEVLKSEWLRVKALD